MTDWNWWSFVIGLGTGLLIALVIWMYLEIRHAPLCDEHGLLITDEEPSRDPN